MIRFLTLAEVLRIHEDQVRRYGGIYGVRDLTLLNSAVYAPQASFEGKYLHASVPEMAAAYAFSICQNHALIDGNKRTALAAALVFLDLNGYDVNCSEDELYETMMAAASGLSDKTRIAEFFKARSIKRPESARF